MIWRMVLWDAVKEYLEWLSTTTIVPTKDARVHARLSPLVGRLGPERELDTLTGAEMREAILTAGTDTTPLRRMRAHWWKCFWQWATSRGLVSLPVETFMPRPWPSLEYTCGVPFSADDIRLLHSFIPKSYDEFAAIAVVHLVMSGVRPSVLSELTVGDVRLDIGGIVHNNECWRLDKITCHRVREWLKVRNHRGRENALFTRRTGKRRGVGFSALMKPLSIYLGTRMSLERCWQHWRTSETARLSTAQKRRLRRAGRRLNLKVKQETD